MYTSRTKEFSYVNTKKSPRFVAITTRTILPDKAFGERELRDGVLNRRVFKKRVKKYKPRPTVSVLLCYGTWSLAGRERYR